MNWIKHQLFDALRFVGLRDRLRCPSCKKVGTWKPHGGWFDFEDERKVRRWLCKWCGYYIGPEGVLKCSFDACSQRWQLPDVPRMIVPHIPAENGFVVCDPWRG